MHMFVNHTLSQHYMYQGRSIRSCVRFLPHTTAIPGAFRKTWVKTCKSNRRRLDAISPITRICTFAAFRCVEFTAVYFDKKLLEQGKAVQAFDGGSKDVTWHSAIPNPTCCHPVTHQDMVLRVYLRALFRDNKRAISD